MLDKMVIFVIGYFVILTYHKQILIAAWSTLLLSTIFLLHEIYRVIAMQHKSNENKQDVHDHDHDRSNPSPVEAILDMKSSSSQRFINLFTSGQLKDSINLQRYYWSPKKEQKIKRTKIIKLVKEYLLCWVYMMWVLAILNLVTWEPSKCSKNTSKCRRLNKNTGLQIDDLFTSEVGVQNLIFFLPLMICSCWKSFVILCSDNALDDDVLVVEELLYLQCKSQIFAAFYYLIQSIVFFTDDLMFADKLDWSKADAIQWIGCMILTVSYLAVKYGWSLAMRISFWNTHLFLDRIVKYLGMKARAYYHRYVYSLISRFAHKPMKQRYIRRYGLYFDLL